MDAPKHRCAKPGCHSSVEYKSAWDNVRAHSDGWFFQKNGTCWCPNHIPDWVAEWRKNVEPAKRRGTPTA